MRQEYKENEEGQVLSVKIKDDVVSLDIPDSPWEKDGWVLTPLSPLTVRITHLIGHSVYIFFLIQ